MKNNVKGITLVSMVITIIVMLILAGVSISMVVGDNGVLTRAQQGSIDTQLSSVESDVGLSITSNQTEYFAQAAEKSAIAGKKHQFLTLNALNQYCGSVKLLGGDSSTADKTYSLTNLEASNITVKVTKKTFLGATTISAATSVAAGCGVTDASGNSASSTAASSGFKSNVLYFSDGANATTLGTNLYVVVVHFEGGFFKIENVGIINGNTAAATTLVQGGTYASEKDKFADVITWLRDSSEVTMD